MGYSIAKNLSNADYLTLKYYHGIFDSGTVSLYRKAGGAMPKGVIALLAVTAVILITMIGVRVSKTFAPERTYEETKRDVRANMRHLNRQQQFIMLDELRKELEHEGHPAPTTK